MSTTQLGLQPDGSALVAIAVPDEQHPDFVELARALGQLPKTVRDGGPWRIYSVRPELLRGGTTGFSVPGVSVDVRVGVISNLDPDQVRLLSATWEAWISAQSSRMRADYHHAFRTAPAEESDPPRGGGSLS